MPREPDFDEGLHPEGPSADDLDRFGGEFAVCPECGREFYDQADICPHCGHAVRHTPRGLPVWAVITLAAVLVALVAVYIF